METIRGKTAIVGVGESGYYKRGGAPDPEFLLGVHAIQGAIKDAGLDIKQIDGFASYSNDRNEATRMSSALGLPELRFSNMMWGGGGGGGSGAVGNAAAAVAGGLANTIVVYRAMAQGQFHRAGRAQGGAAVSGDAALVSPYGMLVPAQSYAPRVNRFMAEHGVTRDALRAISLTSYYHAQRNPRAVMYKRPLSAEKYDAARWITEPFGLYDCCQETDGASAVVITHAERARDLRQDPAYILGAAQGASTRQNASAHNYTDYATSNFKAVARRLYEMAGISPTDIDVAQVYENFTGGVMMSIVEHGFCAPEEVNDFFDFERFRFDGGSFPINTSGGNLAEAYVHGLELVVEAVRQLRGQSTAQVPDVKTSLVVSGPMVSPVSNLILGLER